MSKHQYELAENWCRALLDRPFNNAGELNRSKIMRSGKSNIHVP